MDNKHKISHTGAWGDQTHAQVFDYMHKEPAFALKKHYESFNEGRLLKAHWTEVRGNRFFEIGCATGELYRYLKRNMPRFEYTGFDISEPAIARAKMKYPEGNFNLLATDLKSIAATYGRPDIVWCRDVVLHRADAFDFLADLVALPAEMLVMRLRTRDHGATVTDPEASCQLHWDKHWVPYIVLNTDEMIQKIWENEDVSEIYVARHYEVLGGFNHRYLPKDLYMSSTGTAETAVLVRKGERKSASPVVQYLDHKDRPQYSRISRLIRRFDWRR